MSTMGFQHGASAHKAGMDCVPHSDPRVQEFMRTASGGSQEIIGYLRDWHRGWVTSDVDQIIDSNSCATVRTVIN